MQRAGKTCSSDPRPSALWQLRTASTPVELSLVTTHPTKEGDSARELDGGAPISLASDVSCHFLGDEAILFSENAQRLYRLNTSAALIWCCCEEAMGPAAIAEVLAQTFGVPEERALEDIVETLAQWKALSLVTVRPSSCNRHL